ncbi:protein O-GlcNAcase-like isoform X3 [Aquila chrysaetos chrysaetos]|uniref:protein O-GlcNAcase-like isoform X3 n=1 Tax=Aquila chrysaetos chrysaetos TaxID=223781 RepID=UPI001176914A|nr:protein O-GlcNAcase-like isoform X3 [Aquila chrysaetos chrysaetos]
MQAGFYGRPWSMEQRKLLFQWLKRWGLNCYMYAPKDELKHRLLWREPYTEHEAACMRSLIEAAQEQGVEFVFAISAGQDMVFSSAGDRLLLQEKLRQVAAMGCHSFALLFDDIDPCMCQADRDVFPSLAQAQASVANEVYQELGQPSVFLFCPTEYCSSLCSPSPSQSCYLLTIGQELLPGIGVIWTGPKVVSQELSATQLEEVEGVLRRRPVIWDNLYANDYDCRRVFLGPYMGRAPGLMSRLRGLLLNPNCELQANFIPIHTLGSWFRSELRSCAHADHAGMETATALEDSQGSEEGSYSPQDALELALHDWVAEINRQALEPGGRTPRHASVSLKGGMRLQPGTARGHEVMPEPQPHDSVPSGADQHGPEPCGVAPGEERKKVISEPEKGSGSRTLASSRQSPTGNGDQLTMGSRETCEPSSALPSMAGSAQSAGTPVATETLHSPGPSMCCSNGANTSQNIPLPTSDARTGGGSSLQPPSSTQPEDSRADMPQTPPGPGAGTSAGLLALLTGGAGASPGSPAPLTDGAGASPGSPAPLTDGAGTSPGSPAPLTGGAGTSPGSPAPITGGAGASPGSPAPLTDGAGASPGSPAPLTGGAGASPGLPAPLTDGAGASPGSPAPLTGGAGASPGLPAPLTGGAGASPGLPAPVTDEVGASPGPMAPLTPEEAGSSPMALLTLEEAGSGPTVPLTPKEARTSPTAPVTPEEAKSRPMAALTPEEARSIPTAPLTSEDAGSVPTALLTLEEARSNPTAPLTPEEARSSPMAPLTLGEVRMLVELFYLPYHHGPLAQHLLEHFRWLRANSLSVGVPATATNACGGTLWRGRAQSFQLLCSQTCRLHSRFVSSTGQALLYDLHPYLWDIRNMLLAASAFVLWLDGHLLCDPDPKGTWGSCFGWCQSITAPILLGGDAEPWARRGGLFGELQALLPVGNSCDLFYHPPPLFPSSQLYLLRPLLPLDKGELYRMCRESLDCDPKVAEILAAHPDLLGDRLLGSFLSLSPEYTFVLEDEGGLCGYAAGALCAEGFLQQRDSSWLPAVRHKYPRDLGGGAPALGQDALDEALLFFHAEPPAVPLPVLRRFPSLVQLGTAPRVLDVGASRSLAICLLSTLRANGSRGVFCQVGATDQQQLSFYSKLGFVDLPVAWGSSPGARLLGRLL